MAQRGRGFGLLKKARAKIRACSEVGLHNLDGRRAVEQLMHPAKDLPHTARAEQSLNAILPNGLTNVIRHLLTSNM